jgi:HK97 family phage prohead protease
MGDERPPRENLVRGVFPLELREAAQPADGMLGSTLAGHFAVFDRWTKIDSFWEGTFMESVAPGAFRKTFDDNRSNMRVLFNHGQDQQVGLKPLGPIETLREDKTGALYEVPLLDTAYNRDLLPGLQNGLYGSSFRFSVVREDFNRRAEASDHNPDGIPERIVREASVKEFGPVTFPQYPDAEAGVRSLTDDWLLKQLFADPDRLRQLLLRADPKAPYGDVEYADPGYQGDGKKRYPIDTKEHCQAAWSYINQEKNSSKYSSEDLAKVKGRIKAAATKLGITIADEQKSQEPLVVFRNPARVQ